MPTTRLWCVAKRCPGNRTRFASRPLEGTEQDPPCPPTQEPTPTHTDNPTRLLQELSDTGFLIARVPDPFTRQRHHENPDKTALDNTPPAQGCRSGALRNTRISNACSIQRLTRLKSRSHFSSRFDWFHRGGEHGRRRTVYRASLLCASEHLPPQRSVQGCHGVIGADDEDRFAFNVDLC